MKKVTAKEPMTSEAFTRLLAQYVQQVSHQYPVPKSIQGDLNRLPKQVKAEEVKKGN